MNIQHDFSQNDQSDARTNLFAIVIFLPRTLDKIVAPLRKKFDPDHGATASHITVVFPFEMTEPLESISAIISEETARADALELELTSVGDFYPAVPVIYWGVKENTALDTLHKRLYGRLDLPLPHRQYIPHVTVAKEISHNRVILVKERLAPYLSEESFRPQNLDLIQLVADNRWVSVRSFPFPKT